MTKLFKNSKALLSCVLAFAVLAVSLFTGVAGAHIHADAAAVDHGNIDLLEFGSYLTEAGSTSNYWDTNVADNGETGDSWANAIIIDSAEEMVYLCKASGNETAGKYYKVADGIAGFNFATAALDIEGTLADNLDIVTGSGKNHAGNTPGFQGHFDGNGATVYGAWTNPNNGNPSAYVGLFSCTYGEVTIKNINVNKAYFIGKNAAGGIIGYHKADNMCTVTIENCSITDSYLEVTGTGYGCGVGAIIGFGASAPSYKETDQTGDVNGNGTIGDNIYVNVPYNIKNCYVNLDEANFVSKGEDGVEDSGERVCHGGVMGVLGSNTSLVSDCVVIGIKPYATMEGTSANDVQHSGLEQHFANVYTTEDVAINPVSLGGTGALNNRNFTGKVFPLTDAQLKGAAAADNMDLDWSVWMADDEGYPELANAHKNVTLVDKENGTHAATCACGFGGIAVPCFYVDSVCACGAELTCGTRATIYWDGTVGTGIATGTGTKDDPYIIKTASEFAWLIQQKADVTTGKYYEIDEVIGTIVLQPEAYAADIIALADSAAVKAYFEANAANMKSWPNVGWEGSCFAGIFDGNGTTVYGLYQVSANNAGLFSTIDGGSAIKNIALKNSYLKSEAPKADYQVGGLAANTSSGNYGVKTTGAIWFDSCVVANNYMYNPCTGHDRTGAIIGASSDVVYIDNCLVYGNDVSYGDGSVPAGIWSSGNNSTIASDSFVAPEGLVLEDDGAETPRYRNKVRNSVIFGVKPYDLGQGIGSRFNDPNCYNNVLTDADVATDTFGGTDKVLNVTEEQIKTVTLADLATAELGDAFINTATYPELKSFHDEVFSGDATPAGAAGHSASCSCGLAGSDLQPHDFVLGAFENCVCSVCGYACLHEKGSEENFDGDCATKPGYTFDCPACGYHEEDFDEPFGHTFTYHEAQAGVDCQSYGTIAYKSCDVCNKNYAADASEFEPFENALTDLSDGKLGEHVVLTDEETGEIVYLFDDNNHWTTCEVCQETIETVAHDGDAQDNEDGTHSVVCDVCDYASDAAEHSFVSDDEPAQWDSYYCEVCGYVCEHSTWDDTMFEFEGNCVEAPYYENTCEFCGYYESDKGENDPFGHNFTEYDAEGGADCQTEGTVAHKVCDVCNKNYAADAGEFEPFENALETISDGVVGPCKSEATEFEYDVNGHFKLCDLCGVRVEEAAHAGENTPHGADGHAIECTICDFEADLAPHAFGDDSVCDTCNWECTSHTWVNDGEAVELGWDATDDKCKVQAKKCDICGIAGEDEFIGHELGNWEKPTMDNYFQPSCAGDGQHSEVRYCTVCFYSGDWMNPGEDFFRIVTDAKTGHSFTEEEEVAPTCSSTGTIAHKYCAACWSCYALDAADDEAYENALNQYDGSMDIEVDPEAHVWVEFGSDATCDEDGVVAHKYCSECYLFVVNDEVAEDVVFDIDEFNAYDEDWNPVGPGAIFESTYNDAEVFADFIAENYADYEFELPEYPDIEMPSYPEDDTDEDAMNAYYEAMDAYNAAMDAYNEARWEIEGILWEETEGAWWDAWTEYNHEAWLAAYNEVVYTYLLEKVEAAEIDLTIPAKGHTLKEVEEVAATYEKEGTKAHYVCECGKLFSDAEGKNEVTAESLVIAKLVKEDTSDKSPVTGESAAMVAVVAALMGAAFVIVRKARKA